MKKYFLLVMLMTVVFLWLGNVTMGQGDTNIVSDCRDNGCPENRQTCTEIPSAALYTDPIWECVGTAPSQNQEVNNSQEGEGGTDPCQTCEYTVASQNSTLSAEALQNKINTECATVCTESIVSTPVSSNAPCNIQGSKYSGDTNAMLSSTLLSCKCKPGFGDSDTATTPNICQLCSRTDVCCGVKLNTKVPFIGDCIENEKYGGVSGEEAFPVLMGSLTKILVTVILIVSFLLIVAGGIMIATGDPSGGKKMIIKVVIGIAILGASGVILRLINPNFFG